MQIPDKFNFEPVAVLLDHIHNNPYQPRQRVDPIRVQSLADSIREQGLQQPPQAREKPGVRGCYELVFGHRRTAAYRLLRDLEPHNPKWQRIPLFVVPATFDNQRMFEAAISENAQREDISPIAKALALQRYIQEFRASQSKAGQMFGLTSQGAVSNLLRLIKLPSEVKDLVEQGVINEFRARQMLSLEADDAVGLARELAQRNPEQRDSYFRVNFPLLLRKSTPTKPRSRRTQQRRAGRCPCCYTVPAQYTHGEVGWQCGSCGAFVGMAVTVATPTPQMAQENQLEEA
jgi:ParB family chromosome partitioning protein